MSNLFSQNISEIQLSFAEEKLLFEINKHKIIAKVTADKLCKKYKQDSALFNLLINGLIEVNKETEEFYIVTRGRKWLEFYYRSLFEKSLPIIISILSFIVSVISLIVSILK